MRCRRCKRTLANPRSIKRRFGRVAGRTSAKNWRSPPRVICSTAGRPGWPTKSGEASLDELGAALVFERQQTASVRYRTAADAPIVSDLLAVSGFQLVEESAAA
jgi:hypothetical protein